MRQWSFDEQRGEAVAAAIVAKSGANIDMQELAELVKDQLRSSRLAHMG